MIQTYRILMFFLIVAEVLVDGEAYFLLMHDAEELDVVSFW